MRRSPAANRKILTEQPLNVQPEKRIVLHLDMDAFFAAIEERDHPDFRGFPIVVGADPKGGEGRGVVSTANYAARVYGVHSAQPISQTWRLCKENEMRGSKPCIFFRGNFEKYAEESNRIMGILARFTEALEVVGVDEAFFTLQGAPTVFEAGGIAHRIKAAILETTKLTCSIGIGPNKLIAKIASDFKKPNGLTVVSEKSAGSFLDPLSIRVIPGIGPKAEATFTRLGIRTIAELRTISKETLVEHFGAWGEEIYERALGHDARPVGESQQMKSLGREHTFSRDSRDPQELMQTIAALSRTAANDAAKEHVLFRKIEVKVRFNNFETHTRQTTLPTATQHGKTVERNALRLFLPFLDQRENPHGYSIRLLGVRVSVFKNQDS